MSTENENKDTGAQGAVADKENTKPADQKNEQAKTEQPAEENKEPVDPQSLQRRKIHVDHEDDYKDKVLLSDNMQHFVAKRTATRIVNASSISQHFKDQFKAQIKEGRLKPEYAEAFARMKLADDKGHSYHPGNAGL